MTSEVWSRWRIFDENFFIRSGSRVTAVPWGDWPFALFATDSTGTVNAAAGDPQKGPPAPWGSMPDGLSTVPGAPVTAVPWGPRFALFATDSNGVVHTAGGDPQNGPQAAWGPMPISDGVATVPGAPVAAVPRGNRFAVFVAGTDGKIYATGGDPNGFGDWKPISDRSFTVPGASVTALQSGPGFAVFATDSNGVVRKAQTGPELGILENWVSISEGITAVPGAPVTAIDWGPRTALFATDSGGFVKTAALGGVNVSQLVEPWTSLSGGLSAPGAPVTAVPWGNHFAVFVAGTDGGIYTTEGVPLEDFGGFGAWAFVSDSFTLRGAPVTAIPYTSPKAGSPTIPGLIRERIALFVSSARLIDSLAGHTHTPGRSNVQAGFVLTTQGDPAQPIGSPHGDAPEAILNLTGPLGVWVNPVLPSDPHWAESGPDPDHPSLYPIDTSFEWRQVLLPEIENETQVTVVGASGWIRSPDNSGADVPFSHPFGGAGEHFPYGRVDWEFGLLPDDRYQSLLSKANKGVTSGEPSEAPGTLGVEWEQALIPASFRGNVSHGDRVAIFGRWILDEGHAFNGVYRTEIHPPLVMAAGSIQEDPRRGQFTRVLFMSRPFLAGQLVTSDPNRGQNDGISDNDKSLIGLFTEEITQAASGFPTSDRSNFEMYCKVKEFPFANAYSFQFLINPPAFQESRRTIRGSRHLAVSFQFTVRNNCDVQVESTADNAVIVSVSLNNPIGTYNPFPLPNRRDRIYSLEDFDLLRPGVMSQILNKVNTDVPESAAHGLVHPRRRVLDALGRGVKTSEFDRLPEVDVLDRGRAVSTLVTGPGPVLPGQGVTLDDSQPYPVFGWLEVQWVLTLPVEP